MNAKLLSTYFIIAALCVCHLAFAQADCSLSCRLFTRNDGLIPGSVVDMPLPAKVTLVFGNDTLSTKENLNLDDLVWEDLASGNYTLIIKPSNSPKIEYFFELSAGRNALLVDLNNGKDNNSSHSSGLRGATIEGYLFTYDAVDFGLQMRSPTLTLLAGLPGSKVENKKLFVHIGEMGTTLMEGAMLFSVDKRF